MVLKSHLKCLGIQSTVLALLLANRVTASRGGLNNSPTGQLERAKGHCYQDKVECAPHGIV